MKPSVIVTGGGGNLGSAVVNKLKAEGYSIIGTAVSDREFHRLEASGVQTSMLDLTDEEAVAQFVSKLENDVEAAVLIVGGFTAGGFQDTTGEDLRKMYSLNFETAFFISQALLNKFDAQGGGQLVLVGSRPALNPEEGKELVAYSLSKKLVFYLAELINAYGKEKNIHATVVVPSVIDTKRNREAMPEADYSKWVSPETLADAVHFMLSDTGKQIQDGVLKVYNQA